MKLIADCKNKNVLKWYRIFQARKASNEDDANSSKGKSSKETSEIPIAGDNMSEKEN